MKKRPLRAKLVHQFEKPSICIEVWQDGHVLLNLPNDYYIFNSVEECNNFISNNYD